MVYDFFQIGYPCHIPGIWQMCKRCERVWVSRCSKSLSKRMFQPEYTSAKERFTFEIGSDSENAILDCTLECCRVTVNSDSDCDKLSTYLVNTWTQTSLGSLSVAGVCPAGKNLKLAVVSAQKLRSIFFTGTAVDLKYLAFEKITLNSPNYLSKQAVEIMSIQSRCQKINFTCLAITAKRGISYFSLEIFIKTSFSWQELCVHAPVHLSCDPRCWVVVLLPTNLNVEGKSYGLWWFLCQYFCVSSTKTVNEVL